MLIRPFSYIVLSQGLRWIAVSLLLLAYVLVSWNFIQGDGVLYQMINMIGSALMIVSCLMMKPKDWAVAVFNAVWILVALLTLAHIAHLF